MSESTASTERLLTAADVADRLRVSTMTVYRLIASGRLTGIRLGDKSMRVRPADLDAYIAASTTASPDTQAAQT